MYTCALNKIYKKKRKKKKKAKMLKIQRPKETQKEKWRVVVEYSLNQRWYVQTH